MRHTVCWMWEYTQIPKWAGLNKEGGIWGSLSNFYYDVILCMVSQQKRKVAVENTKFWLNYKRMLTNDEENYK